MRSVLFSIIQRRSVTAHLFLYVKLQLLNILGSHNLKQHLLLLILLFPKSAFFRFLYAWKLVQVIEVLDRLIKILVFQLFIINLLFLTKKLVRIIDQTFRCIKVIQSVLELWSLFAQIAFKVRDHRFSVWILEIEHVFLVLIVVLDAKRLQSELLSYILSFLSVIFRSLFQTFVVFPLSSSLSLYSFVVLEFGDILFRMLFFVLEWMSGWFESALTEFVFTRALESFIVYHFFRFRFFNPRHIVCDFVFFEHVAVLYDDMSTNDYIFIINVKFIFQIFLLIFRHLNFGVTLTCHLNRINQVWGLAFRLTRLWIFIIS